MDIDTGTAIVYLYYFFITMIIIVFVTGVVSLGYYVVRWARAVIHYAARRWWRW